MNEKEHKRVADVEEARTKLLECFPGSLIRDSDNVGYEFIAHPRTNQSFIIGNLNVFTGSMAALQRLRRTFLVCLLRQETETKSVMLLWISLRSRRGIGRW